jgi:predicted dehydrogenase
LDTTRRTFLRGSAAAPAAFTIIKPELVRGWGREVLKAGIIGCGGRGTQALTEILRADDRVELVAMADLFPDKIERALTEVNDTTKYPFKPRVKVDPERKFTGFDSYRKLIAQDIDIVMLCTPPVYRPLHFEAAVEAKKHVFAEKPFGVDPVGIRRFMKAARRSEELKLTVMAGTQRRSAQHYVGTVEKIHNGAIGEITSAACWWWGVVYEQEPVRKPSWQELEYQTRNWYGFRWLSGDHIVEQHVHNIDVINWVMRAHPAAVTATGGVAWRDRKLGNNYDNFSSWFEYANGVNLSSYCRQFPKGSSEKIEELVVGTKGRSKCDDMTPRSPVPPTVQEHIDMIRSIRGDVAYINRAMPVAESTMSAIMAREAAYSGRRITWDEIMRSELEYKLENLSLDMDLPMPSAPRPGEYKFV